MFSSLNTVPSMQARPLLRGGTPVLTRLPEEEENFPVPTSLARPHRTWKKNMPLGYITQLVQFAVEDLCETNSRHMLDLVTLATKTLEEAQQQTRLLKELVNKPTQVHTSAPSGDITMVRYLFIKCFMVC